jgi:hypothetical protein
MPHPAVYQAALSLLILALVACGPRTVDEPPPPAEEWLVGEWFIGDWGDSYRDHHAIKWTRVDADGTWTYGSRGCNGEWMMLGGTWRELEPGLAEFAAADEGGILPFYGYIGEVAQMRFEDTCAQVEIVYFDVNGEAFGTTQMVTRGVACPDNCDGSWQHFAVPCPGIENPCAPQ